jgi:hypothetical protein
MSPWLTEHGVRVVALSKDTPAQARLMKERDGLEAVALWCDPDLAVIKAFGALHRGAIEFRTWFVFGLPLGYPVGFKVMAVPTSFLVDEGGVVRWIDQADDYRMRGDEARIREAIEGIGW